MNAISIRSLSALRITKASLPSTWLLTVASRKSGLLCIQGNRRCRFGIHLEDFRRLKSRYMAHIIRLLSRRRSKCAHRIPRKNCILILHSGRQSAWRRLKSSQRSALLVSFLRSRSSRSLAEAWDNELVILRSAARRADFGVISIRSVRGKRVLE
jgi:hypothetical protein